MKASRLHNLDYLRGVCALAIMIYHYAGFSYRIHFAPDELMQKIGIYGVAIFYVLSGLTLFHVYSNSMQPNRKDITDFFLKRGFRIMPLLWVVILAFVVLWGFPNWKQLILNLTGFFSVLAPAEYFGTGVWSIGNELAFYLLFPVLMLLYRRSRVGLAIAGVGTLAVYCFFAYHRMQGFQTVGGAWSNYVNPLNQAFLFVAGFMAGALMRGREVKSSYMAGLLVVALAVFAFYPVSGTDALPLMQGNIRMLYTLLSVVICVAAYKIAYQLPAMADKPLRLLGEISYSLYLLHTVVFFTVERLSSEFYVVPMPVKLGLSVVGTFIISYISYEYFERPFVKLGRRVSARLAPRPGTVKT